VLDLVAVSDAVAVFGSSRAMIFRLMAGGELVRYKRRGSTATVIDRRQVERPLKPRPEK
jgi:hypothetical protein